MLLAATVIRYKVLTSYSKVKEDPAEASSQKDDDSTFIRDDMADKGRYGSGSYLDEFLIALKIFGYLEKSVFNELVKNMKTLKLQKNDVFDMDDSTGFVIVVEGNVQIYSKVSSDSGPMKDRATSFGSLGDDLLRNFDNDLIDDDLLVDFHNSKYQLLNEVKTGNPLSSLVDILSLFTNEEELQSRSNSRSSPSHNPQLKLKNSNNDILPLNLDDTIESSRSTDNVKSLNLTPDTIAKTTTNSTIAIIPADSFRKLRRHHPKSSAHIVQMILTRLYRVTFQTAHNYLGLTKEIFQTEVKLNRHVKLNVSKYLYDGVMKKFKESEQEEEKSRGGAINKSPPASSSSSSSSTTNNLNDKSASPASIKKPPAKLKRQESTHVILANNRGDPMNPGDLLSSVPLSTSNNIASQMKQSLVDPKKVLKRTFTGEIESHEFSLKIALIEGMFKFLGVDKETFSPDKSKNFHSNGASAFNSPTPFVVYQQPSDVDFLKEATSSKSKSSSSSSRRRRCSTASSNRFELVGNNTESETIDESDEEEDVEFNYDDILREFAENVDFLQVKPNTTLVEKNNTEQNGLYYVVSGSLQVVYTDTTTGKEKLVYTVNPGGVAGYLGCLVGSTSMVSIKSASDNKDCFIGYLSNKKLEILCERYFMIYLNIAKSLIKSLSPKLLKLDSALEWIQLNAGETLFKQDTSANGIYIMLNGRLRSFHEDPETKKVKILNEYGQGQTFGEVEVLTAAKRSSTFIALRDSEAARIPRTLFEILSLENPSIMIKVSRIVANTVKLGSNNNIYNHETVDGSNNFYKIPTPENPLIPQSSNKSKYRTITILPTRAGLPVNEFAVRLIQAFQKVNKSVIGLDQVSTLSHLGRYAFDKISRLKQSGFFSDLEENYEIVVYIADTAINSTWTSTCIQQGDCVLLLADALGDPRVGDYERLLLKTRSTVRTELILLHPERYVEPGLVSKWLKNRVWVDTHHHIQFNLFKYKEGGSNMNTKRQIRSIHQLFPQILNNHPNINSLTVTLKNQVDFILKSKNRFHDQSSLILPHKNDFMRLARILSNQAVAVVLGGGGARGFSHLGVLKALEENGIPIDLVGGTSIGSFIGGLYAKEYDLVPIYGRTKKFALRVGSLWRTLLDLTIPITSYTTGHEFNRGIWKVFGDSRIEDFWLSYYCNSTNITNSCMEIHTKGYAWRYVRASMSLAGLLPPITDKGSMLLDGGYVDNLPVDEMKQRGASTIFAVDVGSVDDRSPMNYGDSLSGMGIFFNRWNPFSTKPNIPTMSEIQLRLCYVASVNALERVKNTPGIIYLRPPIENYATLDFSKFEEIYNVGSIYGDEALKELIENNQLGKIAGIHNIKDRPSHAQRRNSV
jgi:lysophospholipid hydrolase